MKIISIGDLVTDYYYKNGRLLGLNGGMTSHNIILNLAKMGNCVKVIGCCGNDASGRLAIKSLEEFGVDISNITVLDNIKTRCFHVSYFEDNGKITFNSKKRCPFCNEKEWYENSLINCEEVFKNISDEDILVFDNLNNINQNIIDNTKNIKLLDLGQFFEFNNITNDEIKNKIDSKFEIININKRVCDYLIKRFDFNHIEDLYDLTHSSLITITNGKKGADFIYKGKLYKFSLNKVSEELDPTGAGDAFFSSIINSWIKNSLIIDETKLSEWYDDSVQLTSKVVKKMGARGHIRSLYKVKKIKDECYCKNFEISVRKQIKRCNININNLKTRIINGINSNAIKDFNNIDFNSKENYLFVGTGGSFAAAKFAEIATNYYIGSNSLAILPRNILSRNNNNIDKVFMFSYSGTTNDLIESTKEFNNEIKYIITKGEKQKIASKTGISKKNIISYRTASNKGKEKGFLSFEGAVVPSCIFLKYFDKEFDIEKFIDSSIDYWLNYFDNQFKNNKIRRMFMEKSILNIFSGDFSICAGLDLESKIIESGIYDCISHEKKNFSHGRFINYENRNNKNSIYFKQKKTDNYEKKILEYLALDSVLIVESQYDGIYAELDLLIASQYLVYFIGNLLDIDISKPKYSEEAMKIYFYKGNL